MRKTSEILKLAVQHPDYLNFEIQLPSQWLCSCIGDMEFLREITAAEADNARSAVYRSLGDCIFLKAYLSLHNIIPFDTSYKSPEYFRAAHAHWAKLIEELQAQGL